MLPIDSPDIAQEYFCISTTYDDVIYSGVVLNYNYPKTHKIRVVLSTT